MPKVSVKGVDINYFQTGSGPDLVMVHGLGANMAFWYPKVVSHLVKDFRVTLFELRGHGGSSMPPSGYTTRDMAGDLKGLMDSLGIDKAHLAGHSFGGGVALHFSILAPERVLSIALADAVVKSLQPSMKLKDWPYWMDFLRKKYSSIGIELDDELELDADMLNKLADPGLAVARESFKANDFFLPFGSWNGGRKAASLWQKLLTTTTAKEDFKKTAGLNRSELRSVAAPCIAVYGEHSMFLQTMKALVDIIPCCGSIIVPGRGHFHPAIEPGFFAAALKSFIFGSAKAGAVQHEITAG